MNAPLTSSRSRTDLDPPVRAMAEQLLGDAAVAGLPLTVTATMRPMATQAALYAQGRTAPGRLVTDARAGFSYHNFGLALDILPTSLMALPGWGDMPLPRASTDATWARLRAIGKAIGFRWGGEFPHLPDRPHLEWSGGLTLAQLRSCAGQA